MQSSKIYNLCLPQGLYYKYTVWSCVNTQQKTNNTMEVIRDIYYVVMMYKIHKTIIISIPLLCFVFFLYKDCWRHKGERITIEIS